MQSTGIVLTTKCWQMDYWQFLSGAFERKLTRDFDDKILFLNNGVPEEVKFNCKTVRVEDHADEALKFFNLTKDSFGVGYWYSIEELVELYLLKDFKYLVHYSGDAVPQDDWITKGISVLENEPNISVVSPKSEVNTWYQNGVDQFFSDQAYLIRVEEFRQPIYNIPGVIKEYPPHGGDSFEHKAAKYLRANNKFRRILDEHWYHHPAY